MISTSLHYMGRKAKNFWNKTLDRLFPSYRACRLDLRRDLREFEIGEYSWGRLKVSKGDKCTLKIGKYCSFAHNCQIMLGGEHRKDWVSTYRFPAYSPFQEHSGKYLFDSTTTLGDVIINNDVWVGRNVVIMSGVQVGDGVIIGAGSVVRKSIPPYGIASGNPARVHGYRFEKDVIERLKEIAWWNWPTEKVIAALPDILSDNIEAFINKYSDRPFEKSRDDSRDGMDALSRIDED